jgi:hypothetical protein
LSPQHCRGDPAIVENIIGDERESEGSEGEAKDRFDRWWECLDRSRLIDYVSWESVPVSTPTLTLTVTRSLEECMVQIVVGENTNERTVHTVFRLTEIILDCLKMSKADLWLVFHRRASAS